MHGVALTALEVYAVGGQLDVQLCAAVEARHLVLSPYSRSAPGQAQQWGDRGQAQRCVLQHLQRQQFSSQLQSSAPASIGFFCAVPLLNVFSAATFSC